MWPPLHPLPSLQILFTLGKPTGDETGVEGCERFTTIQNLAEVITPGAVEVIKSSRVYQMYQSFGG